MIISNLHSMKWTSKVTDAKGGVGLALILLCLALPALAQQSASREAAYLIRTGDRLSIKFPYHAELNEPALTVRPDGFITLPQVGEIQASGLTVPQLKRQLEKEFSEVLVNPVISVNLTDFVMARVFVGGQVQKAGSIELRAGQTLMQAIILAGGFTNDANRKMVLHARPAEDGRLRVTPVNALEMISSSKEAHEMYLQDGDYIFVPDSKLSKFSRVMEAFRSVIPGGGRFF